MGLSSLHDLKVPSSNLAGNFYTAYFDLEIYTMLPHQQIPLMLAKNALSCWMYPTKSLKTPPGLFLGPDSFVELETILLN